MATISNLRRLEGKVAVITGGAAGIGEAMVRLFHKHGAKIVIADIQDDLGQKLCKELGDSESCFVHCDVRKEADVENAINSAVSFYGKLDIVVNNAGIVEAAVNIIDSQKDEFEKVLSINVVGPFLGIKHAARVMIPNRGGVIISTGSISTVTGGTDPHAYTASKHALIGLTKNVAVELGEYGIRVNCVSPFAVLTPLVKNFMQMEEEGCVEFFGKLKVALLKPEDVAEAALFLVGDESKFVNGHNLMVDGGFTIANRAFSVFGQST